ncbi:2-octaprenyl-6-methoxyphenyl hydroxylase [Vibrio salinus]|uniref:2-octaprenyl-6-methoxyphenyl hydroxylase n=1 Tax=Vibrio salinus TaxID=2899784 RepID=UPI001E2D94ED|nr:2-octaprenyl-6-methoxyphenyl hydroxylase [Vibrio salinus]MCE0494104.1 2-octaprenyl-6-methoxyphenyl hydroxylase [Vibrio salinus]
MKNYDVVIAGGAVVGATFALALSRQAQRSLSIAVVEANPFDPSQNGGFDARSIALSLGTRDILDRFGLWEEIESVATPIKRIHVSDKGHAGMTGIEAEKLHVPALGYVVELAKIGEIYNNKLKKSSNIELICPSAISGLNQQENAVDIELSGGNWIRSKLLVAADGTASECCHLAGIDSEFENYGQVAIIANVVPEKNHNGVAYERFTSEGPVAMLPMSDKRMSLVWCVTPDRAEILMDSSDDEFLSVLQKQFGWRLGKIKSTGIRHLYPLGLTVRRSKISHRVAAVGNAAQTLHPIAGQGFNLGIRDVASLVDEMIHYSGDDFGEYRCLSRYQKRREADQEQTINLTSSLVHTFSNTWLPTLVGRNISLMVADNIPVLKRSLLSRTLGKVPR